MLTYKYRLYPNKEQQKLLWLHANKLNNLYNYFLDQRINEYKNNKKSVTRKEQQKELVLLKHKDNILKQIHSQVIQQVTLRLDKTFKMFFKKFKTGQGFPKFRPCKNFFGICYPQSGFTIEDNIIKTKSYGKIKFMKHRDFDGNIKQIYIKCDNKNNWFLCLITDREKENYISDKKVGIDIGITNLVATSDGIIIKNKNHSKYFDKQINKIKSRRDSLCKKYSRKWRNLSKTVNKLYEMKNNKIKDFLHKTSKSLSSKYDIIYYENLSLKKMSEGKITGLNRELRNSLLGKFISFLEYKTNHLIKVNPSYTSQTCNNCGKIVKMPLNKRIYKCDCGYKEDRDINAAKNIFCLGQAIQETGCSELTIQEALSFREG